WQQQPRDRTDRLAAYFDSIALCLANLVSHLSDEQHVGRRTGDSCSELEVYSVRFLGAVGDILPRSEAVTLARTLRDACYSRRIATELANASTTDDRQRALDRLAEASGTFRGMAATLRV